jgi:hypothetical protein
MRSAVLGSAQRRRHLALGLALLVSVAAACTSSSIGISNASPSVDPLRAGPTRATEATVAATFSAIAPIRTPAAQFFPYQISAAVGNAAGMFTNDPTFGGAYIDVDHTGDGVFLFTGDALSRQAQVAAHLPPGMPFEIRSVLRSQQDLLALKARIEADRLSLRDELGLVSTGIATDRNAVIVGLLDPTPGRQRTFIERYGEGLEFRLDRPSVAD